MLFRSTLLARENSSFLDRKLLLIKKKRKTVNDVSVASLNNARYTNADRREAVREGRKQRRELEWAAVPV